MYAHELCAPFVNYTSMHVVVCDVKQISVKCVCTSVD